jgi:hypothetical protein
MTLQRVGSRGYQATQLEAGTIRGKLYLAAYTLHLGATGAHLLDDDVVTSFHHTRKEKMRVPRGFRQEQAEAGDRLESLNCNVPSRYKRGRC